MTAGQNRPAPETLAKSLQQRYQGIKDFSADFVHSYRGGVLKTQTQERGKVSVKKPSRMHWTYSSPEKKEFVSDGVKIYSYIPQDKQVIVSSVPADNQATSPALFLAPAWTGEIRRRNRDRGSEALRSAHVRTDRFNELSGPDSEL